MDGQRFATQIVWAAHIGFALVLTWSLVACDRGAASKPNPPARSAQQSVEPLTPKPEYVFAAGLEERYPQVVDFLRRFLETSLAGDYAGYRRLVSRLADPESRARFETILNSLQNLTVETIEPVETELAPGLTYRVVSRVEFVPHRKAALRRGDNSRVAILVFAEEGELRMAPAPSEHQPTTEDAGAASQPTAGAPSYPWDVDGDY